MVFCGPTDYALRRYSRDSVVQVARLRQIHRDNIRPLGAGEVQDLFNRIEALEKALIEKQMTIVTPFPNPGEEAHREIARGYLVREGLLANHDDQKE